MSALAEAGKAAHGGARGAATAPRGLGTVAAPACSRGRWRTLGTTAELIVRGDEGRLALARAAVERWLEEVDLACSRFRVDSELSRLNAAEGRAVRVSATLIEATQLALRAALITDGAVDPTLGEALELAGYDRDWALIEADPDLLAPPEPYRSGPRPAPPPRLRVRARPRWKLVRVDPAQGTIALPRGVKLDLGATAKAWAADRAAVAARAASGCGVLVSLGGDIATAGECPSDGWQVHVTDDHRDGPDAPGQTVAIRGGGLATSSTVVRRWRRGGEPMHHIIDPTTCAPASTPWRTVSVAAESCADANIAATAAVVRGESAVAWLAQAGLPARLVTNDGRVATVGSWPREQQALALPRQRALHGATPSGTPGSTATDPTPTHPRRADPTPTDPTPLSPTRDRRPTLGAAA